VPAIGVAAALSLAGAIAGVWLAGQPGGVVVPTRVKT
jgi:hypothetical protein